jgi:cytochrome c5
MRFASLLLICLLLSLGLLACNQAVSTEDSSPAPDLSQASPLPLPSPTQEVIAAAAADSPYPPEMILDGEFNYSIFCAACHGADAAGLENLGSNLLDN